MTRLTRLLAAALFAASPVHAATWGFSDITASFSQVEGGQNVVIGEAGQTTSLSWGRTPEGWAQSGYRFEGRTGLSSDSDGVLEIGTFTHDNNPIYSGSSITGTQLTVMGRLQAMTSLGVTDLGTVTYLFDLDHWETPNAAEPCAAGGEPPCPDLVTASLTAEPQLEPVDGVYHTFETLGFAPTLLDAAKGWIDASFLSLEGESNSRVLAARLTQSKSQPLAVPLLGSCFSLLTGMLALLMLRRGEPSWQTYRNRCNRSALA
ncbi:MAG: THxN family PEP-CTERM protein [Pseudomonadota bacterium]